MPSLKSVLEFRQQMFKDSMALIERKGHDYNREQQNTGDTLFNLKVCSLLGVVDSPVRGILVRLSDKFMRLISLTAPGVKPANVEESVRDTVKDIHNYTDYLLQLWEEEQAVGGTACVQPDPIEELHRHVAQKLPKSGYLVPRVGDTEAIPLNATQPAPSKDWVAAALDIHEEVPHTSGFGVLRKDEFKMSRKGPRNE